jgi:hypothetical protein
VIVSIVAVVPRVGLHAASSAGRLQTNALGPRIVVPAVKAVPVVTDRTPGVREQPVAENRDGARSCFGGHGFPDVEW